MKKGIIVLGILLGVFASPDSKAQALKKLKDNVGQKVVDKVSVKMDAPEKDRKEEDKSPPAPQSENNETGSEKKVNEGTAYISKFDFVPGEKLIAWDDFSQDAVGDFPAKWFTDGSGEVVTIEGYEGNWLMMLARAQYFIDDLLLLPEDFTIQFDLMSSIPFSWSSGKINFEIKDVGDLDRYRKGNNGGESSTNNINYSFRMDVHPGLDNPGGYNSQGFGHYAMSGAHANIDLKETFMPKPGKNLLHVSIWRQKQRIRVYLNENKVLDLPKILPVEMKPNVFVWRTEGLEEEDHYFVGNVRIAVGDPDTRNKLITEGKLVTNGILFGVNSDVIKIESYGVLKEIATILNENNDVKVMIVGHTDSDGDDASNLELSTKRAIAVKNALNKDFSIDNMRMETGGKGESEPQVPNNDAISKARNRRVEFIKTN